MTKYDFGSEIVSGSTMEWALEIVQVGSVVLELGPAIGTLTKHLVEDKKCIVDIVEIDYEAGAQAAKYARKSCLGEYHGNLEQDDWMNILGNEKQYDYVVILDVLEHVKDPSKTLMRVKELVKEEGEIILSLPNVAHNSVVLNLLKNKFEYTDVGLLDDTHVRFFTHKSLDELLDCCGLYVMDKQYKQMLVGENEINNSYSDVPDYIEHYLRLRDFGDVYQFLYRIKTKPVDQKMLEIIPMQLPYTLYPLELFDQSGDLIKVIRIDPRLVERKIEINGHQGVLRIDPLNQRCIITELKICFVYQEEYYKADISLTNGIQINDGMFFLDDDPQIFVECPFEKCILHISYQCVLINNNIFKFVKNTILQNVELNSNLKNVNETILSLQLEEKIKANNISKLQNELLEQKRIYIKMQDAIHSLQMSLADKENMINEYQQEVSMMKKRLNEAEINASKLMERLSFMDAEAENKDVLIQSMGEELDSIKQSKIYKFIKNIEEGVHRR